MGAGTNLFRKLVSVGAGFTITGWDLDLRFGGEATTAATGLTTGTPFPDLGLRWGLSYGPSTFSPPALLTNEDAASVLWFSAGEPTVQLFIVPASTTWQDVYGWRIRVASRYQFRLAAASDFCVQIGNSSSGTVAFGFTAALRVSFT
jgi:hypothetical protein